MAEESSFSFSFFILEDSQLLERARDIYLLHLATDALEPVNVDSGRLYPPRYFSPQQEKIVEVQMARCRLQNYEPKPEIDN